MEKVKGGRRDEAQRAAEMLGAEIEFFDAGDYPLRLTETHFDRMVDIYRELNPSFTKLVGYKEADFLKAAWPSPHDRRDYQEQQDQLRQLASGEVESVAVQSTYMHGQGLMVPVVGELTLVQGEDGLPSHVLLSAEDRAANG